MCMTIQIDTAYSVCRLVKLSPIVKLAYELCPELTNARYRDYVSGKK